MKRKRIYLFTIATATAMLVLGSIFFIAGRGTQAAQLPAKSSSDFRLSVDEGRPLSKIADVLQKKLAQAVSYEDPPWIFDGDKIRAVDTAWGAEILKTHPNFNAIVPKSAALEIDFPVDRSTGKALASAESILDDSVNRHNARQNPGVFRLQKLETGFVIIPVTARDALGRNGPARSSLDFPIYFDEEERSGELTLEIMMQAIKQAAPYRVELATLPKHISETKVRLGARGESARDILYRFLKTHHWADPQNRGVIPEESWRLLFDPKDKYYMLNLVPVIREELDPSGRIVRSLLPRQ
jgi:hypothetical protein